MLAVTEGRAVGKGTKEQSPGRQAGKDTIRDRAVDMWQERREWTQLSGCFLVSNVMTRSLAPMPAGDRSGVGTTRDILKQMSSTPLTMPSAMTLPKFQCDHTPRSPTACGPCALL